MSSYTLFFCNGIMIFHLEKGWCLLLISMNQLLINTVHISSGWKQAFMHIFFWRFSHNLVKTCDTFGCVKSQIYDLIQVVSLKSSTSVTHVLWVVLCEYNTCFVFFFFTLWQPTAFPEPVVRHPCTSICALLGNQWVCVYHLYLSHPKCTFSVQNAALRAYQRHDTAPVVWFTSHLCKHIQVLFCLKCSFLSASLPLWKLHIYHRKSF